MSLIIVSNRLPVALEPDELGHWQPRSGAGGLVTALRPILRSHGGGWIGWPGTVEGELDDVEARLAPVEEAEGYRLHPIVLTREEKAGFYRGFSNEVIWPLFHDTPSKCRFEPRYWEVYRAVNRKYAEAVSLHAAEGDFVWVHDYHLMRVADELGRTGDPRRPAFFLHIPFPPRELFLKLPWRRELLRSLLAFALVGFQTHRDRGNFLQCLRAQVKEAEITAKGPDTRVHIGGREVRVGVFPIGIDYHEFARQAESEEVEAKMRSLRADEPGRTVLLGIDRLDYTKGIPHRLEAFRRALERFPDLRGRVTLLQVVVPGRAGIPEYVQAKEGIERLVGEINGQFTRSGWVPIHYIYRSLPRAKLLAYYRAADIALVTPLTDGMNLVAKEYCAAHVTGEGILVLSEFAGAAAQLQNGALLVNPYDVDGVADAIETAVRMSPVERRRRMRRLRRSVREHDVYAWLDRFLTAASGRDLAGLPQVDGRPRPPAVDCELPAH